MLPYQPPAGMLLCSAVHDIPDSLIQEDSSWHQTVRVVVSAVCFYNGQPAPLVFRFLFSESFYLFYKPFFQGIGLLLCPFLPVLSNGFSIQLVGPFHLDIDPASVLSPELEDAVRVELWHFLWYFSQCQKSDTPGIHFVELVFLCLLITKGSTDSCCVPAGAVKDMFFSELHFQSLAEERDRLI